MEEKYEKHNEELKSLSNIDSISNYNIEKNFTIIVFNALLNILIDSSLSPHHDLTLKTILKIITILQSKTAEFIYILIPYIKNLIQNENLRISMLELVV